MKVRQKTGDMGGDRHERRDKQKDGNALDALLEAEALAHRIKGAKSAEEVGGVRAGKRVDRGAAAPGGIDRGRTAAMDDETERVRRQQGVDRNMKWRGRELLDGGSPPPASRGSSNKKK